MKKTMKWMIALVAAMMLVVGLAGCAGGSSESSNEPSEAESTETTGASEESAEATEEPAPAATETQAAEPKGDLGKVLVVYYSATGTTKEVAGYIAEATDAETFEITPAEPYSDADLDWNDEDSRVSREHADESLRDVALTTTTVPDWSSYDTVFLGYPIWWGIAAWPVDTFVAGNDFADKTVIPFCTSASSSIGESATLLQQLAGTGDWQEGERFSSGTTQSEVDEWVAAL